MERTGFYNYHCAGWLLVRGEDAPEFLQGQFTNDLRNVAAHLCTYGLWLDRKGKVQADSFVLGGDEGGYQIFSYECPAATLVDRLEAFIIADDVEVIDQTDGVAAVAFFGREATAVLGRMTGDLPGAGRYRRVEEGVVFAGRRSSQPCFEWVFGRNRETELLKALRSSGLAELDFPEVETERICSGIPAVTREIGPNDLPQEGGLDLDAVSFRKGCYLGQEVMARLNAMGRVRRRLFKVRVSGHSVVPGIVYAGSREVGELRTFVPGISDGPNGVALLRADVCESASAGLSLEAGGATEIDVTEPMGGAGGDGKRS